jgi:hypothetical protein
MQISSDNWPIQCKNSSTSMPKLVEAENGDIPWKCKTEHDIIPSRDMVCAIVLFA